MKNPNRRELLKYFAVGTVIAPVVAGVAKVDTTAKLIEVPKVELFESYPLKEIPVDLDLSRVRSITIEFTMQDQSKRTFGGFYYSGEGIIPGASAVEFRAAIRASRDWSPVVYHDAGRIQAEGWLP